MSLARRVSLVPPKFKLEFSISFSEPFSEAPIFRTNEFMPESFTKRSASTL